MHPSEGMRPFVLDERVAASAPLLGRCHDVDVDSCLRGARSLNRNHTDSFLPERIYPVYQ